MKIKCDFCTSTYEETLPKCPSCDALNTSHKGMKKALIWFAVLCSIPWIIVGILVAVTGEHNGYYNYNDTYYYKDYDKWFTYDYYTDWTLTDTPSYYNENNTEPYFMGRNYDDIDWNITTQDFILSGGGNLTDFPDVKNSESYKEAHTFNSNKDYN